LEARSFNSTLEKPFQIFIKNTCIFVNWRLHFQYAKLYPRPYYRFETFKVETKRSAPDGMSYPFPLNYQVVLKPTPSPPLLHPIHKLSDASLIPKTPRDGNFLSRSKHLRKLTEKFSQRVRTKLDLTVEFNFFERLTEKFSQEARANSFLSTIVLKIEHTVNGKLK